ncbi:MAG: hypothetical protein ACOX8R_05155 [Bacillota bacterium]|jgi:hypothetical protein
MRIYDNRDPKGRELRRKETVSEQTSSPVKRYYLTEEERAAYGCGPARKKRCGRCGKLKSDYMFFRSGRTRDGLSHWCRACVAKAEKKAASVGGSKR